MMQLWFYILVLVLTAVASFSAPILFKNSKLFLNWIAPSIAFSLILLAFILFIPAWMERNATGESWEWLFYAGFGVLSNLAGFSLGISSVFALRKDTPNNSKVLKFMMICPGLHLLLFGLFALFILPR